MKIDCISDLHGFQPKLPGGDLLIVAGDHAKNDTHKSMNQFLKWQREQPYDKIVFIAGNHDTFIQENPELFFSGGFYPNSKICYLQDACTEFDGLKIYGSPWSLTFFGINPRCTAFTCEYDVDLAQKYWALIPEDVDILVTHMPPWGIFDQVARKESVGSQSLRNMIMYDRFPKLKLHVFGHIHECGGSHMKTTMTNFVNASHVNEHYEPIHDAVRIEL